MCKGFFGARHRQKLAKFWPKCLPFFERRGDNQILTNFKYLELNLSNRYFKLSNFQNNVAKRWAISQICKLLATVISKMKIVENFVINLQQICVPSMFRDEAGEGCVSYYSGACPLPPSYLFRCFLFGRAISVFSERPFKRLRPKKNVLVETFPPPIVMNENDDK